MKLITVVLAVVASVSPTRLYYNARPENSNSNSEPYGLENQSHESIEPTKYVVLGMHQMEQSKNENSQTPQKDVQNQEYERHIQPQNYYNTEPENSNIKSEYYGLENQKYKSIEPTKHVVLGIEKKLNENSQKPQKNVQNQKYERQIQHKTQNGEPVVTELANETNSEQQRNYYETEYISQLSNQNKVIEGDLAYKELMIIPKIYEYKFQGNNHAYQYEYYTENGIQAQESGQMGKEKQVIGAYAYIGDDGKPYSVTYVADEHGFRAEREHLPTPPPMSAAIVEALEKNAIDEANGITDNGQYKEVTEGQAKPQRHNTPVRHDMSSHSSSLLSTSEKKRYRH